MIKFTAVLAMALAGLAATPALAANFEVHMLNKGANGDTMVFEPALTRLAVGESGRCMTSSKAGRSSSPQTKALERVA